MLLDLLRLASLGQNMELYASLQIRQPQNQNQNQSFTINTGRPRAGSNYATHQQPQEPPTASQQPRQHQQEAHTTQPPRQQPTNQCKPLDLSLQTTRPTPENNNDNQSISGDRSKPLPASVGLSSRRRRTRPAPILLIPVSGRQRHRIPKDRLCAHSEETNNNNNNTINNKLISSSTSPSSCSHHSSVSASSLEEAKISTSDVADKKAIIKNSEVISSTNGKRPSGITKERDSTGRTFRRQKHKNLKSHLCHLCGRSFSRSDMLTRHSRLHSGLKPYQCSRCKQVFSRSDHLSTHERTHTGEKPYQCQYCAYSACRRDMITRHMRTHSGSHSGSSPTQHIGRPSDSSPTTCSLLEPAGDDHTESEAFNNANRGDSRGRQRRFRPVTGRRLRRASDPLAVSDISMSSDEEQQFEEDMDEIIDDTELGVD